MDISISAILSILRGFIGALIPPIRKKYFDQPKLYLVFKCDRSRKRPMGISNINDRTKPIEQFNAIYHNDLFWECKLVIRNNTEFPAYNLKWINPEINKYFYFNPEIDRLKPVLGNSEAEFTAHFYQYFEGTGHEASEMIKGLPYILLNNTFILEYTNSKGTKFYTLYKHKEAENERHEFKRRLRNDA